MIDLSPIEIAGRLLAAAVLGGIIGIEREADGQDAGFRTHLLLALGSGLFGVVSVAAFDFAIDGASSNVQIDLSRIAAYVPAGIGFIGGGAILKHAGAVRGITTASSLWVAAAVGLAAGLGFWLGAAVTTGIAVIALVALKPLSSLAGRIARRGAASVIVRVRSDADVPAIVGALLSVTGHRCDELRMGSGEDGFTEVRSRLESSEALDDLRESLLGLSDRDGVVSVRFER